MNRAILISTPARRYAHALLDVAIKQRNFSIVLEELDSFHSQMQAVPLLRQLFLSPAVPQVKKKKVLDDLATKLRFQQLTGNFLQTLMRRERLNLLGEIVLSAEQQFLERQGIIVVEVTTARRLQPDEERRLVAKLEQFTGKKVQLENRIDTGLIGGAVTRIGTTLYDGSVQAQLQQLKARIQEG